MPLAVDPNIAAIIRYGKKHPQYNRAVRIYEQQKYQYDLGQQQEHSQTLARAELQRRAQSGELGKVPAHFLSQDEQAAMAPINAKRDAEVKQAEDQRRKEIGQKNPYRLDPTLDKKYSDETGRLQKLAEFQSDPRMRQELLNQVSIRQRPADAAAAKANLIDATNDPYNKLQAEKGKEQAALQKDAQAKRDAAAADIAKEYMADPSKYETSHGKDASIAAGKIARSYMDQKFSKVGYNGVPLGGDIFDPEGKMGAPGTPAATGQATGQTQGVSRPATATTGQPVAQAASAPATATAEDYVNGGEGVRSGTGTTMSQPVTKPQTSATPATPQGPTYDPSKKYDHIKHAQWIMSLPEEERKRQIAMMDDFQKDFVEKSIDAVKKYEPAYKAVEDAKNAGTVSGDLAEMGRTAMRRLGLGGNGQPATPAEKRPVPSYPSYSVPPVEATTAGERASQAVQSSVIPRRSNEPSPDWGIAYDAAKEALSGPVKAMADTTPGANLIGLGLSAAQQFGNKFTDPYGLKGRPSEAPVDSADIPPPDGSEDEKDPAVIARRLLNTPSAQF